MSVLGSSLAFPNNATEKRDLFFFVWVVGVLGGDSVLEEI